MIFSWSAISDKHHAEFERVMGSRIVKVDEVYWRRVRVGFYRPLALMAEYHLQAMRNPPFAALGGVQFAVTPDDPANSYLNWLCFQNDREYGVDHLPRKRKRDVQLASADLTIRAIVDVDEFKQKGHSAYLSFYERTRYQVGANRRDPAFFSRWADALFRIPDLLILGGYRNGELCGVSISFLVNNVVMYATFFCDRGALQAHLPDLMLHTLRESAAAAPQIKEIFTSMYKGGVGLDVFYQNRGAKIVRQRAWLGLNPVARGVFKSCFPLQYGRLLGDISQRQIDK